MAGKGLDDIKNETVDLEKIPIEEVFEQLKCTRQGLTTSEGESRLAIFGPNKLEEKKESKILKFLGFMWNPLSWVMEAAALMAIVLANGDGQPPDWQDFLGIVVLLVINSTISFIEENNAGNAAAALMIRRCSSLFRGKNTDDVEISKLMRIHDPLLWCHEVGRHSGGDFSFAVLQSNGTMEDKGQVEVGRCLTFVGVYDGHGGPDASHYILNHMSSHFSRIIRERGSMSEEVLRNSFAKVEAEFLAYVKRLAEIKPAVTVTGSCCLVGVFCKNTLYVANLGDSRAVAGTIDKKKKIVAEQLTNDHNASREEIRQELKSLHPDDPQIVVFKNGAWRVKGITQSCLVLFKKICLKKPEARSQKPEAQKGTR